jgi:hypothetical protein
VKQYLLFLLLAFPIYLGAQNGQKVPPGTEMNTTNPPNLSWVVGEFEVVSVKGESVYLKPIKQPLLPSGIKVGFDPALEFVEGNKYRITIKKGRVIGAVSLN